MAIFLTILLVIISVALIASVLLQSGSSAGLSGSIAGGMETFFGGRRKGMDELLNKATRYLAIAFAVIAVILLIIE